MKGKMKPPMHKRVIMTSVAIILGFSIVFGFMLNQLYVQSYIAMYSADLVTAVPQIIGELRRDKVLKLGERAPSDLPPPSMLKPIILLLSAIRRCRQLDVLSSAQGRHARHL